MRSLTSRCYAIRGLIFAGPRRKQAAMTVLATLFDALRRYRKESGRTMAKYIVEYMSDGRLVRILAGDGTEKSTTLIVIIKKPGMGDPVITGG